MVKRPWRLGILTSHPIQNQVPLFRELATRVDLTVLFAHRQRPDQQAAAGFGVAFDWDVDLASGYAHRFLENVATRPGVASFTEADTPGVAAEIASGRFDAFCVMGWRLKCYWQAIRACRRHGVPVLVRGDSQLQTPRSRLKRWVKAVTHRWILRHFDGFLVVGCRARKYLLHYGAPAERLFPSPHCVDVDGFRQRVELNAPNRQALRQELGAGPEDTLALFVGKLVPGKRPGDLVEGAARANRKGARVVCAFVGAGPLEGELRRTSEALGVPTSFPGFRNQTKLPPVYAGADLLVLPSESETWGLVVNEALACGTPVVVSDGVGCAPDLVHPGRTGLTVPVGDVEALAAALTEVPGLGRVSPDAVAGHTPAVAAAGFVEALREVGSSRVAEHQSLGGPP